jgi:hypothetical protein
VGNDLEPMGETHLDASGQPEFDLVAAQLRSDASDTDSFFRVLVTKLSEALGERARLERSGGLLKRDRPVSGVVLDLTASGSGPVLTARRERSGVNCTVSRSVRGIALSTKQVPVSEWIEELVSALSEEAKRSEETWNALHGLLS